jgi:sortase A
MRRFARVSGIVLAALGVLTLAWVVVVWRWQDPFTAVYTTWQQHDLSQQLQHEMEAPLGPELTRVKHESPAAEAHGIEVAAARFRHSAGEGQAIGRIIITRLGLNMVLVNGTDEASLERGPGRDLRTYMPGQSRLVYIAGHRTTFLAPFSNINQMQPGDLIRVEMPYGTFVYRVFRHQIVPSDDLAVLKSPRHEVLVLQACNPRFFATQRYLVYAHLASVDPRHGQHLRPSLLAAAQRSPSTG